MTGFEAAMLIAAMVAATAGLWASPMVYDWPKGRAMAALCGPALGLLALAIGSLLIRTLG